MSPAGTKPSSTKLEPSILTQRSGLVVLIVLQQDVASEFWAPLLAQQSMSGRSWMPPRPLTSCCVSGSQQCRTCSQRGFFCCYASSRATFYLRVRHPDHSEAAWLTFTLGSVSPRCWDGKDWGSLPFHLGDWARSAHCSARAAFWGSWADCLHIISQRQGDIARTMPLLFTPGCRVMSSPVGRGRVRLS